MELHERQQFDFLLHTAVERYVERLEQRNEGANNALQRLRENPEGQGVWLSEFVEAVFGDFLLNNSAGAGFVMRALASRKAPVLSSRPGQTMEQFAIECARAVFGELFRQKTEEVLEQHASFEAVPAGTDHGA
jgi:hypothetical protein